jgi:hypothetical protein
MADPQAPFDPEDPMQVAIRFERNEGQLASMQLAMTNAHQNLASAIQGLQAEVREFGTNLNRFNQLEYDRQSHGEGLARAFEAIAKLSALHEKQWEQHALQEAAYRERMAGEAKITRDKMMRWSGGSIAGSVLLGTVVALVTWIYLTDKTNNQRDIDQMRAEHQLHLLEADKRMDKIEGILIEHCVKNGKDCQFER